ncbi:hypothetical protein OIU77_029848 [Salix suchowensis]|uniref:Uncharacterized protein n=1 Tax=Salix suchowensis TaxID=1278906 RepID=A0ABQ9BD58_9ROSI|nr:hypothetical protein OIU77_029848 [Salix suchowensis]
MPFFARNCFFSKISLHIARTRIRTEVNMKYSLILTHHKKCIYRELNTHLKLLSSNLRMHEPLFQSNPYTK